MTREKRLNFFKATIIFLGAICFGVALLNLPSRVFSWVYLVVLVFSVFVAPRMTLQIPRSRLFVNFPDTLIFLSFLIYGGEAAIVLATVEMLANCFHNKRNGNINFGRYMIATNTFACSIYTTITYLVWLQFAPIDTSISLLAETKYLILILGFLAFAQFMGASVFASLFQYLKNGSSIWETWKKNCFSSSMSQVVGAGIAGVVYKVLNYADFATAFIAFAVFWVIYFNYRQSISEINKAIIQAEDAERARADAERERRVEAEEFAGKLSVSLEKEEQSNAALRRSEKDFQHAALHDALTGLANRKRFGEMLRQLIAEYKLDPTAHFQVLFLDIRSFKNINDTLGHTIGDKVLSIAGKRVVRMLNSEDSVARIGGDEFAVILRGLGSTEKAQKVAKRIHQNITQPFSLSGNQISVDINIGIAPFDAEYDTPEEILRDADIAMHYAKEKNNGLAVFTKELRDRFLERVSLEIDLRHAIDRNELSVHYQPIVSLIDGRLIGFEALLRWHHNEFGMIPPSRFIPIAESSGLIQPITVWILEQTSRHISNWQMIDPEYKDLMVSVNISGKHLSNYDLIDDVKNVLDSSQIKPATLKLEITESVAMVNAEHTINVLNKLKKIGVQLSIDDFVTGYSSLSYLHRLPFDSLKIDRSFVYNVGPNGENAEILQTIISLAKNLKMRVIAEGIETESPLAVLQNLDCDYGQGFLLAKPKGHDETEKLLYQHPNWLPQPFISGYASVNDRFADEFLPVF